MGHWAKINDENVVIDVIVADDDMHDWLVENLGGRWIQTSYNTSGGIHYDGQTGQPSADQSKALRKNYAGIGHLYDEELDAFIMPKPGEGNWILDEFSGQWISPE